MKIAVTGNIGCGKSTFVQMLLRALPGYQHFDFDAAVHSLYDNAAYFAELEERFGTTERRALSDIVFANPDKKTELEGLSAGHLRPQVQAALRQASVVVEFPLLFESGWNLADFDHVIAVDCSETTQRARIRARNGFTDDKITRIQQSQCSAQLKACLADTRIDSDVSLDALQTQVQQVAQTLRLAELQEACVQDFGSEAIWAAIEAAYTAPGRRYHTLEHLRAMLRQYARMESSWAHPQAVRWAIWFHDFVYDTQAQAYGHNEARSARALFEMLRQHSRDRLACVEEGVPCLTLAAEMILATKRHQPGDAFFATRPRAGADCRRFLDIDLAILAQTPDIVEQFDAAVREEFSHYPEGVFAQGRVQALSAFLERERVFFSDEFASYEARARENLARLVAHWRNQA